MHVSLLSSSPVFWAGGPDTGPGVLQSVLQSHAPNVTLSEDFPTFYLSKAIGM